MQNVWLLTYTAYRKEMEYIVRMPYIGSCLSKNGSRWPSKRGFLPVTKSWMLDLWSRTLDLKIPKAKRYNIKIHGVFKSEVRPDMANLHEVIGDSLKRALDVDDKYFFFTDEGYEINFPPELIIKIIPVESRL